MKQPILLTATDPIMAKLDFKPYRNTSERRAVQFLPAPGEPQTLAVETPWGATLVAKRGDYLVSEVDAPEDRWPVACDVFEKTYMPLRPGYYIKRAVTYLVPLADVTGGNPDRMVTVRSLEGDETVRAGDFYLARGIKGEIWPVPSGKIGHKIMRVTGGLGL